MLTGADGQVLLEIDEIDMAVLRGAGRPNELPSHIFALEWEPVELDKPTGAPPTCYWSVIPPGDPLLAAVRSGLSRSTRTL